MLASLQTKKLMLICATLLVSRWALARADFVDLSPIIRDSNNVQGSDAERNSNQGQRKLAPVIPPEDKLKYGGQRNWVSALAFTADSKAAVAGHEDGSVTYWNTSGRSPKHFKAHEDMVHGIAARSNGEIVSWSRDETVDIIDMQTGKQKHWKAPSGCQISHGAMSPDGALLATDGAGPVLVWNLATGKFRKLDCHPDGGRSVSHFSADSKLFAIELDQCVVVYDSYSLIRILKIDLGGRWCKEFKFSPAGDLYILVRGGILQYQLPTGKLLREEKFSDFDARNATVGELEISPNGTSQYVVGETSGRYTSLIFPNRNEERVRIASRLVGYVTDQQLVSFSYSGGFLELLEASGRVVRKEKTPGFPDKFGVGNSLGLPYYIALSRDRSTIALASRDWVKMFSLK